MKFSERLFKENKNLWEAYLVHPFIAGMKDGTLPLKAFQYYLIQDYHYLIEYTKVFGIGISKAKNPSDIESFAASIAAISWEISNVHNKYMERIGITDLQIQNTPPSLSNISYTSYMLAKANDNDEKNAFAAVLSCSWSYAFIGKIINEQAPNLCNDNIYGEWVKAYSSDEYQDANQKLIETFDKKCQGLSDKRLDELAEIFRICSEFEMRFWDMAYSMGDNDKCMFGDCNA